VRIPLPGQNYTEMTTVQFKQTNKHYNPNAGMNNTNGFMRNPLANNYLQPEVNMMLPEPQLYDQNGLFDDYQSQVVPMHNTQANFNMNSGNRGRNKNFATPQSNKNPLQQQTTPKGNSLFTLPKQQPPERHPQSNITPPGGNKKRPSAKEHTSSPTNKGAKELFGGSGQIQIPLLKGINNPESNFQHMTKEEIQNWKVQSEEDLHLMSQKHEQLIGVILAEEEEVISLHRQHIDDTVELIKQVE